MSIEILRAKMLEAQQRQSNNQKKSSSGGDKASFPFWDTPEGQSTTIRFLRDGDPENPFFWVERQVIKLPFDGVVGGEFPTAKPVEVQVPCVDMFGMACPIIAATRPLWEEGKTDPAALQLARTYYKKRSYIFQGFVTQTPIVEEESPENPIRRFVINKSIYDIVYASLLEPNFESMPTDHEGGRDFVIRKTKKGEWANYGTSNWSFAGPRSLSETERAHIQKHGLFNLKDALGAVPTADGVAAIKAMFEDSFAGKPFDMESYGSFYRPYGSRNNNNASTGAAAATTNTVNTAAAMTATATTETPAVVNAETASASEDTSVTSNEGASAIIARLRANSSKLGQ
jgi:hypothetical protein